jgi:Domain of unknown function (DUF6471)
MIPPALKRRNVSYKELAEKRGKLGVEENDRNIANKLACGAAIGCETVHLDT